MRFYSLLLTSSIVLRVKMSYLITPSCRVIITICSVFRNYGIFSTYCLRFCVYLFPLIFGVHKHRCVSVTAPRNVRMRRCTNRGTAEEKLVINRLTCEFTATRCRSSNESHQAQHTNYNRYLMNEFDKFTTCNLRSTVILPAERFKPKHSIHKIPDIQTRYANLLLAQCRRSK